MLKDAKAKLKKYEALLKKSSTTLKKALTDLKSLKQDTSQKNYEKVGKEIEQGWCWGQYSIGAIISFMADYTTYAMQEMPDDLEGLDRASTKAEENLVPEQDERGYAPSQIGVVESVRGRFKSLVEAIELKESGYEAGIASLEKKFDVAYKKVQSEISDMIKAVDDIAKRISTVKMDNISDCGKIVHDFSDRSRRPTKGAYLPDEFFKPRSAILQFIKDYCQGYNKFKKTDPTLDKKILNKEQRAVFKQIDNYLNN
jgi:hypothetical protein